jgi:hypothetical protein
MTIEKAKDFAEKWITSWNDHDVDSILSHYADKLEFYSPFIPLLKFNETGIITSKAELKKYFEVGLNSYPDLHFKLHNYFVGINTVVLYYTSVKERLAAEVFIFDKAGQVVKVYCNYSENK